MARAGWEVTVLEKHDMPGGRARKLEAEGFVFDMGPSWYWMPDIFERYFTCFGKRLSDYYTLTRLDPSYRIYYPDGPMDIPADTEELKKLFDTIEPGSGAKLDRFLAEAQFKYETGMHKLVFKPGQSLAEFLDAGLLRGVCRLDVFRSMRSHVQKYFSRQKLQQLMEFPVLFLGALPEKIPALYSLMNYADIRGGTWYPQGGMYRIVEAMYQLAKELGVHFSFGQQVTEIVVKNGKASAVHATDRTGSTHAYDADAVIGAADYHHIETQLLPAAYRSYSEQYWEERVMAPSCILFYVGLNKKLENIRHHSLFFDSSFALHGSEIYTNRQWPTDPLFYVSAPSVTDPSVAPEGCENLFLLVPVAAGLLHDTESLREKYFEKIMARMEKHLGQSIRDAVIYKKSFSVSDFISEYHAFKGNAYGLANTLLQTAVLKPSCRSKKISNLFYAGQLTVPGPGVPPSLVSGEVVAGEVLKQWPDLQVAH